jgi:FAD/FMN-containing dehydrogenase
MQKRSVAELAQRRRAIVSALGEFVELEIVNGGGTGSLELTAAEEAVTEVTAGSGFYAPALFDHYSRFSLTPAAGFALPIVRKPASGVATALGGGYLASGAGDEARLPAPWLPEGLELDGDEGAGEVQTPLLGPAAAGLEVGDRVFANERRVRFTELEYGVPREHGPEAVRRVIEWVRSNRYPVFFPIEMRVAAGDDALLSPSHERDTTYIAVHQYRGMEWRPYFEAVEAIMDDYGGRPHWGKRHFQTAETLAPRYPRWADFQAVRDRLDPGRVFTNEYAERVLGP